MVMTFSLINTPATFQHLMNHVFESHNNTFLVVYLDNILIFSETKQEHLQYVWWALNKLWKHNLYAKAKKCEWM
jgi:Reverse transcriptase (RNA-dependent DNA polymerase)